MSQKRLCLMSLLTLYKVETQGLFLSLVPRVSALEIYDCIHDIVGQPMRNGETQSENISAWMYLRI